MKYAIVDIETTGSPAATNGITEIAIVFHDGKKIEGRYETLVNPMMPIPPYVAKLTHISDEMVKDAPLFKDIAHQVYALLQERVFVAHNVAFDYPFLQYNFLQNGLDFKVEKLCTIKMSRKAFPGMQRYGLDYLCQAFNIPLTHQHRAGGDAIATAIIFDRVINNGGRKLIEIMTEPPIALRLPSTNKKRQKKESLK